MAEEEKTAAAAAAAAATQYILYQLFDELKESSDIENVIKKNKKYTR